jgi:hypothetical protein
VVSFAASNSLLCHVNVVRADLTRLEIDLILQYSVVVTSVAFIIRFLVVISMIFKSSLMNLVNGNDRCWNEHLVKSSYLPFQRIFPLSENI